MDTHADKDTHEDRQTPAAESHTISEKGISFSGKGISSVPPGGDGERFLDNRPEAVAQRQLQKLADESVHVQSALQLQRITNSPRIKPVPVIQRAFNADTVRTALLNASGPAEDMGGTTGGAYDIITGAADNDVSRLVLKVGGSSKAVLASSILSTAGIRSPQAVMINIDGEMLAALKRINGILKMKVEDKARKEVQQHIAIAGRPNDEIEGSKDEKLGGMLAADTLLGNHDRIHSKNRGNIAGSFAIDNAIHKDTPAAKAMMSAATEIVADSRSLHHEMERVSAITYANYSGDLVNERKGMLTQRAYLLTMNKLGARAGEIAQMVDVANEEQDITDRQRYDEIQRLLNLGGPDPGSAIDQVAIARANKIETTREDILSGNLSSLSRDIGTMRYEKLLERLAMIDDWHQSGEIAEALMAIDEVIANIESDIRAQDEQNENENERARSEAVMAAQKKWEKKKVKLFTNQDKYVKNLMKTWDTEYKAPRKRLD